MARSRAQVPRPRNRRHRPRYAGSVPTEFRLRFPLSEVEFWAARYASADDTGVEAIGEEARQRGWYTRDEFLAVMRWKSVRTHSLCERNTEAAVVKATKSALYVHDQPSRVRALTALQGVGLQSASILLHFAHRDPYPILDDRALWSLSVDPPPTSYSFELWWQYARKCRALGYEAGVSMRTLQRALWQYATEHQEPR
jgi:hypothetical protein